MAIACVGQPNDYSYVIYRESPDSDQWFRCYAGESTPIDNYETEDAHYFFYQSDEDKNLENISKSPIKMIIENLPIPP